jgi:hypothetical protein
LELFDETLAPRYDYLVTSSDVYEFFFKLASLRSERVESCEEQAKFYEELFENELIAEFEPDPWKTPGPTIRIYRIPN